MTHSRLPAKTLLLAALALVIAMAGCLDATLTGDDDFPLQVYRYHLPGDDRIVDGVVDGWLFLVTNPTDKALPVRILPVNLESAKTGPVTADGWQAEQVRQPADAIRVGTPMVGATPSLLAPGESRLWMVHNLGNGAAFPLGVTVSVQPVANDAAGYPASHNKDLFWVQAERMAGPAVAPGDHVQTVTVGVWSNGTSFYTNYPQLEADDSFPQGYPDSADGAPLPIYVYGSDRSEQPGRSRDTCHFTTIDGYNALLKEQAEGHTGVRFLTPEEAYTRPGLEDFFLYGQPLIFLNSVLVHDGPADATPGPDPTGSCVHPNNHSPVPLPLPSPLTTTAATAMSGANDAFPMS